MADTELFVICNNCGSEVSPYVTECPYCGYRLRKRAPDLKKVRKQEDKDRVREIKRAKRLSTQMPTYLTAGRPPIAISTLIVISVVASIAVRVNGFPVSTLVVTNDLASHWWQVFSQPFFHDSSGYAFVALLAAAMFGSGIERRFGPVVLTVLWLLCGAAGVLADQMIAVDPVTFGACGVAIGLLVAWLVIVMQREDLRDYDLLGLSAASAVVLALPLATDEASVWTLVGGLLAGGVAGLLLGRFGRSSGVTV